MKAVSELVEAAQAGDSAAYAALIQRFQPMAYATAYRHLRDHHLAQDLVQEAVIEALIHLAQRKRAGCLPWLVSPDCLPAVYPGAQTAHRAVSFARSRKLERAGRERS